jgi:hypothetical protein
VRFAGRFDRHRATGISFKTPFRELCDRRPTGQNARRKNGEKARPQLESVVFEAENCAGGKPKTVFSRQKINFELGQKPWEKHCKNMTTPWRGAAPPGRRHE